MKKLQNYHLLYQGKVRDVYQIDERTLLMVASDRISAFDVVLPNEIPGKGELLTKISLFWFEFFRELVPNHLRRDIKLDDLSLLAEEKNYLKERSMIVKKLKPLPIEAIVRGYLAGSAWQAYQEVGKIIDIVLPAGLKQSSPLHEPIFTPSTKAKVGDHDENISFNQCVELIGQETAKEVKRISLKLYNLANQYAQEHGIIIADTKLEFGVDERGDLHLIDEVLTPDCSRFWDKKAYKVGTNPASFDKQYVRDWLRTEGNWDGKSLPPPSLTQTVVTNTRKMYSHASESFVNQYQQSADLPQTVIKATQERYRMAYKRLCTPPPTTVAIAT